jgi:hypothetical protein
MSYALVYGSLYVDKAESWEFAETQIDDCIGKAQRPQSQIALLFDIVATPAQIASGDAHDVARYILKYADEQYPNLKLRTVGITDDDDRRPARDIVITQKMQMGDVDNVHLFVVE